MKTSLLQEEFVELRERYDLQGLRYFAFKPTRVPYFNNPSCRALYVHNYDCVVIRNGVFSKESLKCMLHEMCHAIQNREGRFAVPKTHFAKLYALEIEAEVFARVEYRKLYSQKYGPMYEWDLASFDSYCEFYKTQGIRSSSLLPMTPREIYSFVKSLKGLHKKPILSRLDGKKTNEWERQLSRVCV